MSLTSMCRPVFFAFFFAICPSFLSAHSLGVGGYYYIRILLFSLVCLDFDAWLKKHWAEAEASGIYRKELASIPLYVIQRINRRFPVTARYPSSFKVCLISFIIFPIVDTERAFVRVPFLVFILQKGLNALVADRFQILDFTHTVIFLISVI